MSACEICWTAASHKSLMGQGFTTDLYKAELAAHPEHEAPTITPIRKEEH